MYIRDIDFGKIDAYNELQEMGSEKYLDSFFDYEKYHISDFVRGSRYYICGNKGTGKTALLKYLEIKFKDDAENIVLPIRFKTDIDELDRKDLRKGTINNVDEVNVENARYTGSYKDIWQVFLIQKILEEEKIGEYRIFADTKNLHTLTRLVSSIYTESSNSLIPKIKKGKISADIKLLEKIEAELDIDLEVDRTKKQADFARTAKAIIALYNQLEWARTPVYVLIDELELSAKSTKARRQDIELVRDLILSVNRLNEISKRMDYHIHFIASIREEVIRDMGVAGTEINKCIEDYGISIDWSYKGGDYRESPLLKIVERKIHASEKASGKAFSEDIWKTYFVPIVNGEETRKYILSYTWQKPRDIIRMLRQAQEQAAGDAKMFTQEMFDRALQKYSERAWSEICEELVLNYNQNELDLIKKLFTGISIPFTYANLQNRIRALEEIGTDLSNTFLSSPQQRVDFLNVMYRWGIIGNSGKRMMFSFLGYNDLDITGKMVLHKPLRNFFGVQGNNS